MPPLPTTGPLSVVARVAASPTLMRTGLIATYIVALRGANVALLIALSHLLPVEDYGQLSGAYVFASGGAQIIGAPLAALTLRVGRSQGRGASSTDAVLWWATLAVPIAAVGLLLPHDLFPAWTSNYFHRPMIALAALWMIALGLELLSAALAIAQGRIALLAAASVVQAVASLGVVCAAVVLGGTTGLMAIPVCGAIAGGAVVLKTLDWARLGEAARSWIGRAWEQLRGVIGPAVLATVAVTVLSMVLVAMTAGPLTHREIALFGIGMQIVGIATFVPQVLSTAALEAGHRAAREGRPWRIVLGRWAALSGAVSLAIGAAAAAAGPLFSLAYGDGYDLTLALTLACGALIATMGPVNVLSHVFVVEGRQWAPAVISLIVTALVIGGFAMQADRSAAVMLWSVAASNALRCAAFAVSTLVGQGTAASDAAQTASAETPSPGV